MAFAPEDIDYRIKKQFQDAGSDDPPIMGAAIRFITSAPL